MPGPNVVFILADQHRFDFIGHEKNGRTFTPHLDELGRRGVIFRNAYCNAPMCSPSRICLASGRYGTNTGCFTNAHELPPHTPSFVSQFRSAGYRTCAVGKTNMEIQAYDSDLRSYRHREYMESLGWDEICEVSGNGMLSTGIRCAYSEWLREQGWLQKVAEFYAHWPNINVPRPNALHGFQSLEWPFPEEYQETTFIGRNAADWIRNSTSSQPFFLHVGFAGPHSPLEPLPRYKELYHDSVETGPWGDPAPSDWLAESRRSYRAMISQIDHHVGLICQALKDKGLLENTIVIYTADHGEMAGDHGRFDKSVFFEPSVHVPLLAAGPGIRAGGDSGALVEIIDLGQTLSELCSVPSHPRDQGRSFASVLGGRSDQHRETVYAEMMCDKMLFDGRYKLMLGDPATEERKFEGPAHTHKPANIPPNRTRLFDLRNDPRELNDLSADCSHSPLLARMLEKLLVRVNENTQFLPFKNRGQPRPLA